MLERDPHVENPTKRQIAIRLGVPPHLIAEFVPPPTPARIAALSAVIDEAIATGDWSIFEGDGRLTHAPDTACPPGDRPRA